ncbi:MAG: NUDIX domain-containing protein [Halobacteriaceae archaeon]
MERTDTGEWCLPGGHTDIGESPDATAVREAHEETGLVVEPDELVGTYQSPPDEQSPYHFVAVVYVCEVVGGELDPGHEAEDLRYAPVERGSDWLRGHRERARDAREVWRG